MDHRLRRVNHRGPTGRAGGGLRVGLITGRSLKKTLHPSGISLYFWVPAFRRGLGPL